MAKYNADTSVTFSVSTGYSGCRRKYTFTLGEVGFEDFDDELIEDWIEDEYRQWLFETIDGGWSIQE